MWNSMTEFISLPILMQSFTDIIGWLLPSMWSNDKGKPILMQNHHSQTVLGDFALQVQWWQGLTNYPSWCRIMIQRHCSVTLPLTVSEFKWQREVTLLPVLMQYHSGSYSVEATPFSPSSLLVLFMEQLDLNKSNTSFLLLAWPM